jgi:hypothetical protein
MLRRSIGRSRRPREQNRHARIPPWLTPFAEATPPKNPISPQIVPDPAAKPRSIDASDDEVVRRGAMRSLTADLARQSFVAAGLTAFVVAAAIGARPGHDQAALATDGSFDKPILVKAIVSAVAQPQPAPLAAVSEPEPVVAASQSAPTIVPPVPAAKSPAPLKTARQACAASCGKIAAAPRAHPTAPAAPAPEVVASIAPTAQVDSSPSLRKRLFAPVGFIRENVVRLIQWL